MKSRSPLLIILLSIFTSSMVLAQTIVGDTLSGSTTWTKAGSPYWITSTVLVLNTDTLTIEAGVVVKFAPVTNLFAQGAIIAKGMPGDSIIFTSEKDDSVGGDTNGDLNATTPMAGDWGGIFIRPNGEGHFAYSRFKYGSFGVKWREQGSCNYCFFSDFSSNIGPTVVPSSKDILLENLAFGTNIYKGVGLESTGISGNYTLAAYENLPYLIKSLFLCDVGEVTIQAGTVFKFLPSSFSNLRTTGTTFNAMGTANDPIVFTSVKDDSVLGDSNQDGSASSPEEGDWGAIAVNSFPGQESEGYFEHCHFLYGGAELFSGVRLPVLLFNENTPGFVKNCTFNQLESKLSVGLSYANTKDVILENLILGADVYELIFLLNSTQTGAITLEPIPGYSYYLDPISFDFITAFNGQLDLTIAPGTIFKIRPTTSDEMEINCNLFAKGTEAEPIVFTSLYDDAYGGDSNKDGSATTPQAGDWGRWIILEDNETEFEHCIFRYGGKDIRNPVLEDNGTTSVYKNTHFSNALTQIPLAKNIATEMSIENVTFDASLYDAIGLNNTSDSGNPLTGDYTLSNLGGYPFIVYDFLEIIGEQNNLTLNFAPGTVVKVEPSSSFSTGISFTLAECNVLGEKENPVIFTSVEDDQFGGDTNKNGDATTPEKGDWDGIEYGIFTSGHIQNTLFKYSVSALIDMGGSLDIENITFSNNTYGFRVFPTGFGNLVNNVWGDSLCFYDNNTAIEFSEADTFQLDHIKFQNNTLYAVQNRSEISGDPIPVSIPNS